MTPETERFPGKAHKLLNEAEAMLSFKLYDPTGRAAYLAGFHAAQALISERTGRTVKTHKGVQIEFHRLTKADAHLSSETRSFLSRSYNLKAIADYETEPGLAVLPERAGDAVEQAKRFIAYVWDAVGRL